MGKAIAAIGTRYSRVVAETLSLIGSTGSRFVTDNADLQVRLANTSTPAEGKFAAQLKRPARASLNHAGRD